MLRFSLEIVWLMLEENKIQNYQNSNALAGDSNSYKFLVIYCFLEKFKIGTHLINLHFLLSTRFLKGSIIYLFCECFFVHEFSHYSSNEPEPYISCTHNLC